MRGLSQGVVTLVTVAHDVVVLDLLLRHKKKKDEKSEKKSKKHKKEKDKKHSKKHKKEKKVWRCLRAEAQTNVFLCSFLLRIRMV